MLIEIPGILSARKLQEIQTLLADAPFVDGKLSAGMSAKRVKHNEELPPDAQQLQKLNQLVMNTVVAHPQFQNACLPHRIATPFYARYGTEQAYGKHIDDPVMGPMGQRYRSDISMTIFLNSPDDYQGGELRIHTQFGAQDVKLPAGHAIVYPSSSLHEVRPIQSGTRLVAVTWIQSLIRDPQQRDLLYELSLARDSLMQTKPDATVTQQVDHSYVNLVRMWSEV